MAMSLERAAKRPAFSVKGKRSAMKSDPGYVPSRLKLRRRQVNRRLGNRQASPLFRSSFCLLGFATQLGFSMILEDVMTLKQIRYAAISLVLIVLGASATAQESRPKIALKGSLEKRERIVR